MFSERTVVVTGAAGGIGQATALRLAENGATLGLLDRDADALALTAERARDGGARVVERVVDIADQDQVGRAFTDIVDALGLVHGLVCAAGILRPGALAELTVEDWQAHHDVNTTGVLFCLQAAEEHLADGGAVVAVSSNAARVPRVGMLAYAASKAATSALVRCAGLELATRGIRCNVVEPGSTDTAMQRNLWPDPDAGRRAAVDGDPSSYRLGIPLRRIGAPEDVAAMVCFLLSDDARHVTLQQVYVDGGASL